MRYQIAVYMPDGDRQIVEVPREHIGSVADVSAYVGEEVGIDPEIIEWDYIDYPPGYRFGWMDRPADMRGMD